MFIVLQATEARRNTPKPRREAPVSLSSSSNVLYWEDLALCHLAQEKCLQSPAPLSQSRAKEGGFELRNINFITRADAMVFLVLKKKIYFLINYKKLRKNILKCVKI